MCIQARFIHEVRRVVDSVNTQTLAAHEIAVVSGGGEAVALSQLRRREQLVENVEVALVRLLSDDTRLLQKVALDGGAADAVLVVEVNLDPLSEARTVVVANRLGVTKGLQNGVGLQNALLQIGVASSNLCDEAETLFGRLRFARAALAGDENGLVGSVRHQLLER